MRFDGLIQKGQCFEVLTSALQNIRVCHMDSNLLSYIDIRVFAVVRAQNIKIRTERLLPMA